MHSPLWSCPLSERSNVSPGGAKPPAVAILQIAEDNELQVASRHKDCLLQSSWSILQSSSYPLCQGAKTDGNQSIGLTLALRCVRNGGLFTSSLKFHEGRLTRAAHIVKWPHSQRRRGPRLMVLSAKNRRRDQHAVNLLSWAICPVQGGVTSAGWLPPEVTGRGEGSHKAHMRGNQRPI